MFRVSNPRSLSKVRQIMHVGWAGLECWGRWEEAPLGIGAGSRVHKGYDVPIKH